MYSTASATEAILSASASGISIANSSSMAMTTSTASKESNPRSSVNLAPSVTLLASTLSKALITSVIRPVTSAGSKKVEAANVRTVCACLTPVKRLVLTARTATREARHLGACICLPREERRAFHPVEELCTAQHDSSVSRASRPSFASLLAWPRRVWRSAAGVERVDRRELPSHASTPPERLQRLARVDAESTSSAGRWCPWPCAPSSRSPSSSPGPT